MVLDTLPSAVVAGGAAGALLRSDSAEPSDVDIFIVGVRGDKARWEVADNIIRILLRETQKDKGGTIAVAYCLTKGLISLYVGDEDYIDSDNKYQIILRAFPSIASLLHGFDLGSSAVAYDGRKTYLTGLGAYAYTYMTNLVNPAYRSTTFEARLIKYSKRGFSVGLPHLDTSKVFPGRDLKLPHLTISPRDVGDNVVYGRIVGVNNKTKSDYDPIANLAGKMVYDLESIYGAWNTNFNLGRLSTPEKGFAVMRILTVNEDYDSGSVTVYNGDPGCALTDFSAPRASTLGEITNLDDATKSLDSVIRSAIYTSPPLRVRPVRLVRTLGMTPKEVGVLAAAVAATAAEDDSRGDRHRSHERDGGVYRVKETLAPFKQRRLDEYREVSTRPLGPWWIVDDPSRQYTVSLNPRIEDPSEWYGDAYAAAGNAPAEPADDEDEKTPSNPNAARCSICLQDVTPGDPGTIVLCCGHAYHWRTKVCLGLSDWITASEEAVCPNCRDRIIPKPEVTKCEIHHHYEPDIEIAVDWAAAGISIA